MSSKHPLRGCVSALALMASAGADQAWAAAEANAGLGVGLEPVIVTARQRQEDLQSVPVSVGVLSHDTLTRTITYDIAQVAQLVPSLYYNSPNPRNTAVTIRGLGSSVLAIAQSNDGLEPGVGVYVDQVYHGRPATAAFDFVDVEQVEVLRGPQGTVFGKNTTAGAINIKTREPSFTTTAFGEATVGELGHRQGKLFLSGPIIDDKVAASLSVVATARHGVIRNVTTGDNDNTINTAGVHGQVLLKPKPNLKIRLSADYTAIDSTCCTQVYVRVGTSLKAPARQYPALAAALGYTPASLNPYDRLTDIDAPLRVHSNEGGVSSIAEWDLGPATVTSVSAWRWWNWDAANDRDYTRLSIQTLQHIPSRQDQYSQELRIASNGRRKLEYVGGLYWFSQDITGEPITQYGPAATFWLLGPTPTYPGNLLDGYGTDGHTRFHSDSYAVFGETTWRQIPRFSLTTGLRFTDEEKRGQYASTVYGGLTPTTTALANAKLSILRPQSYSARNSDASLSGRAVLAYDLNDGVMAYFSYANSRKSGGLNMSGLPLTAANQPALATAVIKPEKNQTFEVGLKTQRLDHRLTVNIDGYDTTVHDFQTNVVDSGPGALRGYLANIAEVRVRGVELDSVALITPNLSAHVSGAYADGKYVSYRNGPCPLERIGSATTVCDLSGEPLSALPRWAWSVGGEYHHALPIGPMDGEGYLQAELSTRSSLFGDPTDSVYSKIGGYALVNASLGYRWRRGVEIFLWAKNLLGENNLQNITVQAGNSGLIVGTPGDPRMAGVTLRLHY